jgi:hypothetical protein
MMGFLAVQNDIYGSQWKTCYTSLAASMFSPFFQKYKVFSFLFLSNFDVLCMAFGMRWAHEQLQNTPFPYVPKSCLVFLAMATVPLLDALMQVRNLFGWRSARVPPAEVEFHAWIFGNIGGAHRYEAG